MKKTLAVAGLLAAFTGGLMAQSPAAYPQQAAVSQPSVSQPGLPVASSAGSAAAAPRLEAILAQIQKATVAMNADLSKLRIEKWRTDADQKDQLQKLANSLQRNVSYAVPGLISDVQNSRGSVTATFKLYHDVNVVYEYLNSITDAAGSLGKREEYDPLSADAAALDAVRESLSNYIEQTALLLETPRPSVNAVSSADAETLGGHKIIVEEVSKPVKPTKKKTSATPTSAPSTAATPSGTAAAAKATQATTTAKPTQTTPAKPSPAKPVAKATPATAAAVVAAPTPAPK